MYKRKGSRDEFDNYRGISFLSVAGKVQGRVLNERMKITNKSLGNEQGFRSRRKYVDQIFSLKMVVKKYL